MTDPLVFLPGLQADRRSWVNQIHHFAGRRPTIVPDGHYGCSTMDAMADQILPDLPERFHLVAWSMGGYIALALAPRLGDRLLSLVLVATAAGPDHPENARHRRDRVRFAEREGLRAAQRSTLIAACADPALPASDAFGPMLDAAEEIGLDAYRNQQEAIIGRPDRRDVLASIACPILVIAGADDRVTPVSEAQAIVAAAPNATLHVIGNCGHCPPLERPEIVNELLERWLSTPPN